MTLPTIQNLIETGALFVCNHSGGKDSQAMYAHLRTIVPADQLVVVHADLGDVEWTGVQDHIRENIDHELHVVRAGKTLFEMVERRAVTLAAKGKEAAPWPSSSTRQCTSDLKRDPIAKWVRNHTKVSGHTVVVNCLGLRAQESTARAKKEPFKLNKRETTQTRTVWEWLPILEWLEDKVWATIAAAGQVGHWAYRAGMTRLSCCFCVMASKGDLTTAARLNPELYARYVEMENRLGYTVQSGKSLEDITGVPADFSLLTLEAS